MSGIRTSFMDKIVRSIYQRRNQPMKEWDRRYNGICTSKKKLIVVFADDLKNCWGNFLPHTFTATARGDQDRHDTLLLMHYSRLEVCGECWNEVHSRVSQASKAENDLVNQQNLRKYTMKISNWSQTPGQAGQTLKHQFSFLFTKANFLN